MFLDTLTEKNWHVTLINYHGRPLDRDFKGILSLLLLYSSYFQDTINFLVSNKF